MKLGLITLSICSRCHQYYLPSTKNQTNCTYCQGKSYPLKNLKCKVWNCSDKVGKKGGRGLCAKHYSQLVRWPREKIKLMQNRTGYKICKTFDKCEIIFKPKSKFHFYKQLYCENCREIRKKIGIDNG